jgi:hypothetical protein
LSGAAVSRHFIMQFCGDHAWTEPTPSTMAATAIMKDFIGAPTGCAFIIMERKINHATAA